MGTGVGGQKEGWMLGIREGLSVLDYILWVEGTALRYFRRSWVGGDSDMVRFRKLSFYSVDRRRSNQRQGDPLESGVRIQTREYNGMEGSQVGYLGNFFRHRICV